MTKKSDNPFFKRMNVGSSFEHGKRAENNLSKRLGLQQQPGSGNMEGAKGDLRGTDFLIECKSSKHGSMSLELSWLTKIKYEARDAGKEPALSVNFVTEDGKPKQYGSWVMIEEKRFQDLMEFLDEINGCIEK